MRQLTLFPMEELLQTKVVDDVSIETKLKEVEVRTTDNDSMEAMYISFVRKIYNHHGDEGFTYFVDKFKQAGGKAKDFRFDSDNYRAFKYALVNVIQKYGKI